MGPFTWEALIAGLSGVVTVALAVAAIVIALRQTKLEESVHDPMLVPTRMVTNREEKKEHGIGQRYGVELRNPRVGPALRVTVTSLDLLLEVKGLGRQRLNAKRDLVRFKLEGLDIFLPLVWGEPEYFGFDLPPFEQAEEFMPRAVLQLGGHYETAAGKRGPIPLFSRESVADEVHLKTVTLEGGESDLRTYQFLGRVDHKESKDELPQLIQWAINSDTEYRID